MKNNPNIEILELVAAGLGALREKVVFVGGTTTAFYITDPAAIEIRPTNDVDCIIELTSMGDDYYQLEKKLRTLGFKNHIGEKRTLICRWEYHGVIVDIMPADGTFVGFTNQWYSEGMHARIKIPLPSKNTIFVLSLPYFIATKFEAFTGRGQGDYRTSHDIEDILTVLEGNKESAKFLNDIPHALYVYLKKSFTKFFNSDQFTESLEAHLGGGMNLLSRLTKMTALIELFIR